MKKYKLIKELPFENSPKIGYISESHTLREDSVHYYNGNWFYPDKYPEFWEEVVVKKDYEILSVITNNNKFIEKVYNQDAIIEPYWKIHSVKRKDGEIFTIGDKTNFGLISKIVINNNSLSFYFEQKSCGYNLQTLIKWKPLFTTEDGVDIFEGDTFYYVKFTQYNMTMGKPFEIVKGNHPTFKYEPQYEKYFSTKEKAEEYIIMNKPCLSLNDVAKVYVSAGFEITKSNKHMKYVKQQLQLRELIKTKLKKAL